MTVRAEIWKHIYISPDHNGLVVETRLYISKTNNNNNYKCIFIYIYLLNVNECSCFIYKIHLNPHSNYTNCKVSSSLFCKWEYWVFAQDQISTE